MNSITAPAILTHFEQLTDPRLERTKLHALTDMVVIALCAAEGWADVERFGKMKQDWFARFLELPHGIPSYDTFGRVFARLNTNEFLGCPGEGGHLFDDNRREHSRIRSKQSQNNQRDHQARTVLKHCLLGRGVVGSLPSHRLTTPLRLNPTPPDETDPARQHQDVYGRSFHPLAEKKIFLNSRSATAPEKTTRQLPPMLFRK